MSDPLADQKKEFLDSLKPFKFYLTLLKDLLYFSLEKGTPLSGALIEVRDVLQKDIEFLEKIKIEEKGSLLQFISLIIFVWIFIFMASYIASIQLSVEMKFIILCIQFTGLLSFLFIVRLMIHKNLKSYDFWICRILSFQSLLNVGVGLDKCFPSDLTKMNKIKPFDILWRKLEYSYKAALERGKPMRDDLQSVKTELLFARELNFKKWQKRLAGIKLIWLFLFFFSSYLICIASLFGKILIHSDLSL